MATYGIYNTHTNPDATAAGKIVAIVFWDSEDMIWKTDKETHPTAWKG
jgi:hypothetical protein